jgi:RNA polymerase sigma-70 factor, ECF subfamily
MADTEFLTRQFEANRDRLRAVAYRMLGSLGEADDAVQEAWLRLSRSDTEAVANLAGWLTTVTARVCLDMLRTRESRREDSLDTQAQVLERARVNGRSAEEEAILAESVGIAMLVVLETLEPAERVAFVLHDMFGVPFEQIGDMVGRSAVATRQLASRARRRVKGANAPTTDRVRQQKVVDAYLAAARAGDFEGLLALLAPDIELRSDAVAMRLGAREARGSTAVAEVAIKAGARAARLALIDGAPGLIVAPEGHLVLALVFTFQQERIATMDVIADPSTLNELTFAIP